VGLFTAAALLDPSGDSRVLFILVPFAAYFAFGRGASLALGGVCLALLIGGFALRVPHWYVRGAYLSDVLMFGVGLVLAISMAGIAVGEQAGRVRLEAALRELRESHDQLTVYAARVAGLSARASARRALQEVRGSVAVLRGGEPPGSLSVMLAGLVAHAGTAGPQVTLAVTGDEAAIAASARTVLFRAAQEALTNTRRHSGARRASVTVTVDDREARLVVADDGRGFEPLPCEATAVRTVPGGFGLAGIRERAALAGGHAQVDSQPGAGTIVTVTVPLSGARSAVSA
jgi:signal transduction histidine kinase